MLRVALYQFIPHHFRLVSLDKRLLKSTALPKLSGPALTISAPHPTPHAGGEEACQPFVLGRRVRANPEVIIVTIYQWPLSLFVYLSGGLTLNSSEAEGIFH